MVQNGYTAQGQAFLDRFGLGFEIWQHPDQIAPPWIVGGACGLRYTAHLDRPSGDILEFDFWGANNDRVQRNAPTAYAVLASISSDAGFTDADEVFDEYGLKPSSCERIAKFGQKLEAFFTEEELEALLEIS